MSSFNSKYQVTSLGFLPNSCIKKLPDCFVDTHLQVLLDNLSISDGQRFRSLVRASPLPPNLHERILAASYDETCFLYTVLTFIVQKYVWGCGPKDIITILPKQLGLPLLHASKKIGMLPVLTYAASVLWNWSLKDESQPFSLENLQLNYKIMEGRSYEWFFVVHAAIEGMCGYVLEQMMLTKAHMLNNNKAALKETIKNVMEATKTANNILMRMKERCVPEEFWEFRIYLSGTQDPLYFPKGLEVEGIEGLSLRYRGPNGSQSSLIQALDIFYSIVHGSHEKSFINESKMYMPATHTKYLQDLGERPILREYVEISEDEDIRSLFKEGVATLERFRKSHIGVVHSYIGRFLPPVSEKLTGIEDKNVFGENGSGGSHFKILLNNIVQATMRGKSVVQTSIARNRDTERMMVQRELNADKKSVMMCFIIIIVILLVLILRR